MQFLCSQRPRKTRPSHHPRRRKPKLHTRRNLSLEQLEDRKVLSGIVITSIGDGTSDRASACLLQDGGRIVVSGSTNPGSDGSQDFAAVRYQPDGILDQSFGTGGIVTYPSTDTPLSIADPRPKRGDRPTASTISITSNDLIGALVLDVDITHGAESGLTVTLASPTYPGDPELLSYDSATDTWSIAAPNLFIGQPLGGTWTLTVTDTVKDGITGTLESWSMIVTPTTEALAPTAIDRALLAWFDAGSSKDDHPNSLATQAANDLAMLLVE